MKTVLASPPAHSGVSESLAWGKSRLTFLGGEAAQAECEFILESLLGVSRAELYLHSEQIDPGVFSRFREKVEAREKRLPLAYVLGEISFWDARLEIESGVFVPRPETEGIIENFLKEGGFSSNAPFRFLDLGTGSGAIALTISRLFSKAGGAASDISWKALEVARRNAKHLEGGRIQWVRADGLPGFGKETFDVIFSNPPYLARQDLDSLDPEVRSEPRAALDGGEDGLDFYRRLKGELGCLKRGGGLWVEIGWGQADPVRSIFESIGFDRVKVFRDLNGIDRVAAGIGFCPPHPSSLSPEGGEGGPACRLPAGRAGTGRGEGERSHPWTN